MTATVDVAIVGGGLVGAACADALAGDGHAVAVFDRGPLVREASWAGAGILHPIHPWKYPLPLQRLLRIAPADHPPLAADLRERTGIDVELEPSGILVMGEGLAELAAWCGDDLPHRLVDARADDPGLPAGGRGLLLERGAHVRNHLLARALLEGARRRGARLHPATPVLRLLPDGLETPAGRVSAGRVVLAAGAWAGELAPRAPIEPVRGQILLYRGSCRRVVIFPGGEYAVPRRDGFLLFGSTLERAGYAGAPTEEACAWLAGRARHLLGLSAADLQAAWAGLRPGTSDLLPHLGPDPVEERWIHASGHYRNGILLAPLTGRFVADLVAGRAPAFDPAPFAVRNPF